MAVTYRVIERYSKRRFKTSDPSSTLFPSSSVWSFLAPGSDDKNWAVQYISFLFGLSAYCQIRSIVQKCTAPCVLCQLFHSALMNLTLKSFVSYCLTPVTKLVAVVKWSVKRLADRFFDWTDLYISNASEPSWSVMVYLIDARYQSVFKTRQAIMDEMDAAPALKLLCQKKLFGKLEIWRCCPDADIDCYSLVRELSPVFNRELVTQETVHDYVTDVVVRQSGADEPDSPRYPWRIHVIPLAFDPSAAELCSSTCCLVAQCHQFLTSAVDNLIRRALKIQRMDIGSLPSGHHHYPLLTVNVQRSMPTGSQVPAVSWTKAIPRADFIDRVCSLAGTTIRELFIVAFSQSLNQCYNQSGLNVSSGLIRIQADAANQPYSLPLGTPLLEDGHLVLDILRSQRLDVYEKVRWEPVTEPESRRYDHERTSIMNGEPEVSVRMESATADNEITSAGIDATFRWTAPRTSSIPIHLALWIGRASVRLGMIQRPHPALVRCPLRVDDIERRVYQLAASCGVQTGRPLSPHSTPTTSPGCTPPPTPRPR